MAVKTDRELPRQDDTQSMALVDRTERAEMEAKRLAAELRLAHAALSEAHREIANLRDDCRRLDERNSELLARVVELELR